MDCGWRVGASLLEHCNWLPARARVRRGRGHSGTAQPQARAGGRVCVCVWGGGGLAATAIDTRTPLHGH